MKTRTLISILILILAVLLVSSCVTTPKTKEDREVFFKSVRVVIMLR